MNNNKIIWHQGMFLQAQHFQQHDRHLDYQINQKFKLLTNNSWGFSKLSLDLDLLSLGKIGISEATGIFPDGTVFNIPRNDSILAPYTIDEGISNTTLYLSLPLKQPSCQDAGTDADANLYRYQVMSYEVSDSNTQENNLTEIQVGSLACKILSTNDDLSAYTTLAIARIEESRSHHQIQLDNTFLCSYLDVQQAPALKNIITEVHGLLTHRAQMLAQRLTNTGQTGTADVVDFMLLQLANRYQPIFRYLQYQAPLHPEVLYFLLIQLMGEMATFTNNKRRAIQTPIYQHKDLFNSFKPIINEVRHALSMVLEQNATAIRLQAHAHGLWVGQITDKGLLKQCDFVLAVYADLPTENIRAVLPEQIKIAPVEQIKTLVSKALPGISITNIAIAPRQIPYHANFSYFSLNTQHELWQLLEDSAGIALHIGSNITNLKLELWAIKG